MTDSNNTNDIDNRILDAAGELFIHYGYDKTTMNDIAKRANVSKSTIYTRWNKKEDLFDALFVREGRRYTFDWFDRVEADPKGGTYGSFMRHALLAFDNNPFFKALYGQDKRLLGSMLNRMGLDQLFARRMVFFKTFFKAMQDAGVVRQDIDGDVLTFVMNTWQYGFLQFPSLLPNELVPPTEQSMTVMVDMIERYVTPEGGGNAEAGKRVIAAFRAQIVAAFDSISEDLQNNR